MQYKPAKKITFIVRCNISEAEDIRKNGFDISKLEEEGHIALVDPVDEDNHTMDIQAKWTNEGKSAHRFGGWMRQIASPILSVPRAEMCVEFETEDGTKASFGWSYGSVQSGIDVDADKLAGEAGDKLRAIAEILAQ